LHKLSKRYFPRAPWILADLNLHIQPGQFVFLTGTSGSGKTTLLRLLYGAEIPSQGTIKVGGVDMGSISPRKLCLLRRKLGIVFQDFRLINGYTVLENVAWPLHLAGWKNKQMLRAAGEMLEQLDLLDKADYRCEDLSGGEQQRVAVARALAGAPPLVLADEPTGNLDPDNAREVMRLFLEAHQQGTTVLVATHDPLLLGLVHGGRLLRLHAAQLYEESRP
jgi:cell division transport system ATP-binding protein